MKKVTYIASTRTLLDDIGELYAYRELILFFVWRDLLVRYKQTAIGAVWLILRPLSLMVVLWAVFGQIDRFGVGEQVPYAAILVCGLVPWFYFASAVGEAANSLIGDSNLVSKVYFPRMALPLASVIGNLVDFVVLAALCTVLGMTFGFPLRPQFFFLLPLIGLMVLAAAGAGLILSILSARYRDFRYVTGFLIQVGMFASPVIYLSKAVVPAWLMPFYCLNPMAGLIEGIRWAALGLSVDPIDVFLSAASAICLFVVGIAMFVRLDRSIADVV